MGGPSYEFVQSSEIRDASNPLSVCLWDKESRAAPGGVLLDWGDHLPFDQFCYCLLGFRLVVLWHSSGRCDAYRYCVVSCNVIDIGAHFIGQGFSSSLSVLLNLRMGFVLSADSDCFFYSEDGIWEVRRNDA